MATIPSLADGTVLHGSDLALFGPNRPFGAVSASAAQTLTNGTWALITFNTLNEDTDPTMWTVGNPGSLYLNTPGRWQIGGGVEFAINATSFRAIQIRKNSSGSVSAGTFVHGAAVPAISGTPTPVQVEMDYPISFNAGDYLQLFGLQFSGGNLATAAQDFGVGTAYLTARWMNL